MCILQYTWVMVNWGYKSLFFSRYKKQSKYNQKCREGGLTHNALRTGSDRFQVLVSLQNRKLSVAHLDGVEGVTCAHVVLHQVQKGCGGGLVIFFSLSVALSGALTALLCSSGFFLSTWRGALVSGDPGYCHNAEDSILLGKRWEFYDCTDNCCCTFKLSTPNSENRPKLTILEEEYFNL